MKKILLSCLTGFLFLTTLNAQTTVFSEDFQSGIPATWTIIVNDTNTVDTSVAAYAPGWIAVADPDSLQDTVAGATSFFETPAQASRWLITPPITLGAYGNILYWEARSQDPSFPDGYLVLISTTDTQIASFTDTLEYVYPEGEFWTQRQVNMSDSGYFNQTVHIAFVLRTFDAYKLYLDDISVSIEDPAGMDEVSKLNAVIYPNPGTSSFAVRGDQADHVRIFATNGTLVLDQQLKAGESVGISTLQNGTYIVELTGKTGISRQRFVKI